MFGASTFVLSEGVEKREMVKGCWTEKRMGKANGSEGKETGTSLERRERRGAETLERRKARGCLWGKERGTGLEFWMKGEVERWSA